jgi:hypothetical protein
MKDIRAVLAEKETESKRVWQEVSALRIAVKLCEEPSDAKPAPEEKPESQPAKAWP